MKFFRVKDKLTGLYYIPSRDVSVKNPKDGRAFYVKSNLSKKGKVYNKDPRRHITGISDHTLTTWPNSPYESPRSQVRKVTLADLELEEI